MLKDLLCCNQQNKAPCFDLNNVFTSETFVNFCKIQSAANFSKLRKHANNPR